MLLVADWVLGGWWLSFAILMIEQMAIANKCHFDASTSASHRMTLRQPLYSLSANRSGPRMEERPGCQAHFRYSFYGCNLSFLIYVITTRKDSRPLRASYEPY
jgi:hypothetical protein